MQNEERADLFFLTTVFVICQKMRQPGFWEVVDSLDLLA